MAYALHRIEGLPAIEESRKVTPENIRYGMQVQVLNYNDGGYHSGCKVHFFNKKGVLVGNYYEFMPYERLRLQENKKHDYCRFFMSRRFTRNIPLSEKIKTRLFIWVLNLTGYLLRFTQKHMD